MVIVDLVVPIGADQQQVSNVRLSQEILEQVERRSVQPLKIIEKERQRMFLPGEDADEAAEHELEATLRLLRLKFRDPRLLADDEVQLRDEVSHQPSVRPKRLHNCLAPARQFGVALTQKRPHQALKSLHQSGIGDVPLQLVELA